MAQMDGNIAAPPTGVAVDSGRGHHGAIGSGQGAVKWCIASVEQKHPPQDGGVGGGLLGESVFVLDKKKSMEIPGQDWCFFFGRST